MSTSSSSNGDSWQQLFQVPNPIHNETGYWGPVDANHQFCEPHYAVTSFAAEFFNSVSSIIYTVLAFYMMFSSKISQDFLCKILLIWLAVIGLGSLAFHATMRYEMQLADEIPMVGFIGTVFLSKVNRPNLHPWVTTSFISQVLSVLVVAACIALIATYMIWNEYEIFARGFQALCIINTIVDMVPQDKAAPQKLYCHVAAVLSIGLGAVFWEMEHRLCQVYPMIWPFHVCWHFCSCASAYYTILCSYLFRNSQEILCIMGVPEAKPLKDSKKQD